MSDMKDAAHLYRERGWRVIQLHRIGPDGTTCSCNRGGNCTSKGKHPVSNDWQNTEPYSGPDIEALWDASPKANIGIATGAPSGFWVLDIDPKSGGAGSMRAIIEAAPTGLPQTYVVQTGSGGWHYYFTMPDFEVTNSQGRVGPGIDVRGTGGQVVAAPSRSAQGDYTILSAHEPAPAPGWLLDLIRKPEPATPAVTADDLPKPDEIASDEWDRLNRYTTGAVEKNLARLDDLITAAWTTGWNATLFEVCCSNLEFANSPWNAYSEGQAFTDIFDRAPRDDEGFDDALIRRTWESAKNKIGNKARAVPDALASPPSAGPGIFGGIDVRGRAPDPTGPDADRPAAAGRHQFWVGKSGNELDVVALSDAITEQGPIAWAREEAFWAWDPKGVWVPYHDAVINRTVDLLGPKFRNEHAKNASTVVKRHSIYLTGDPLEKWMNFGNGMLDWQTQQMTPHDPDMHSTVQFDINWNPDATCDVFDNFLTQVMHPDYIQLAWEMIGYLMYSGNPLQVAFMLYGKGGNGKGTLLKVIEHIIGQHNIAAESLDDLNHNRFSAVNLYGKIANIAGDIDGTYQESTANFKKLTGQDTYAGERKFGQRFNFENWAVPVFSANKIPGSADVTEGYLRRWVLLHFNRVFEAEDRILQMDKVLFTQAEGIAVKAVTALADLMKRRQFAPQGEALRGKEMFARNIDQVRQYLDSGRPSLMLAPEGVELVTNVFADYKVWTEQTGSGRSGGLRQQEFVHRLEGLGFETTYAQGQLCFRGLKVIPYRVTPEAAFIGTATINPN